MLALRSVQTQFHTISLQIYNSGMHPAWERNNTHIRIFLPWYWKSEGLFFLFMREKINFVLFKGRCLSFFACRLGRALLDRILCDTTSCYIADFLFIVKKSNCSKNMTDNNFSRVLDAHLLSSCSKLGCGIPNFTSNFLRTRLSSSCF